MELHYPYHSRLLWVDRACKVDMRLPVGGRQRWIPRMQVDQLSLSAEHGWIRGIRHSQAVRIPAVDRACGNQ